MKVIQYLPGYNSDAELTELINDSFTRQKPLPSFDGIGRNFLSNLSGKILDYSGIKNFPELVALAFWLRKSNLSSITSDFQSKIDDSEISVPRGLAFHIAPSNVDSIFLYSWALSLLAGNTNVVRISQNINPQMELLLDIVRGLLDKEEWLKIKERNIIISYPRDEEINAYISSLSDVRIIWGGDKTIGSIKELPSKPGTKDILFADKFSYTVINASIYNALNENEKSLIARNFYNDAYWFDQMACSSPRFVLFTGLQAECEGSSKKFWNLLGKELDQRGTADTADAAMEKLVYMYETVSKTDPVSRPSPLNSKKPAVLRVSKEEIKTTRESCGGGFFFECFLNDLDELAPLVNSKDQTLTYFGYFKEDLKSLALKINGSGLDRIVPIGQALNFSPTWDGYSLLNELTKRVAIIA